MKQLTPEIVEKLKENGIADNAINKIDDVFHIIKVFSIHERLYKQMRNR